MARTSFATEPERWPAVLPLFTIMTDDARLVDDGATIDADDDLYPFKSSRDSDPSDQLDRVAGPLPAVNFGDDLLNPAGLGLTEAATGRVKDGIAVLVPAGPETFSHQTLGHPEVRGPALATFTARLPKR